MEQDRYYSIENLPIVVADSDKNRREELIRILEDSGYRTKEFSLGTPCLNYCIENPILCLCLGGKFQDLDSEAVCKRLREMYTLSDLPIIFIVKDNAEKTYADLDINDVVFYPYDPTIIVMRLNNITQMRKYGYTKGQLIKLQAVSVFAMGVSHNFNNIMCAIEGAVDVLSSENTGKDLRKRCTDIVNRAIKQGKVLTGKMSVISSMPGRTSLKAERENIMAVVESVVDVQRHLLGDKKVVFNITKEGDIPDVAVNVRNLVDIVTNVVRNAVEAISGEGSVDIRVIWKDGWDYVELLVIDSGCGIPEEILSRVYDPFFSTKHMDVVNGISTIGNGLGLWNVYNLLKMLGGGIDIRSAEGRGTSVEIKLPVA